MGEGDEISDTLVPGLTVRAGKDGSRSFLYRFSTMTGERRRPKIGNYPMLSIAGARDVARGLYAQAATGVDPIAERAKNRAEPTLDDVWKRAESAHYSRKKEAKALTRLYERCIGPSLGSRKITSISRADVRALMERLGKTPSYANRVKSVLSTILNLAAEWEMVPDLYVNPCERVRNNPEHHRRRFATEPELDAIAKSLQKHSARDKRNLTGAAFIFLLIFTGARPSEIGNAMPGMVTRSEQDGETVGVLHLAEHKTKGETGEDRSIQLSPQAMKVIDSLPMPRRYLAGRKTVPVRLWKLVRADVPGIDDLWMRDMRRTFASTMMSKGGATGKQMGKVLGHKTAQTTERYIELFDTTAREIVVNTGKHMAHLLETPKT
jgi:integrase